MKIDWNKEDFERKFGFKSKKHTGVNNIFSFMLAIVFFMLFYLALFGIRNLSGSFSQIKPYLTYVNMFFHGGPFNRSVIPYFIVFLSSWSLAILFIKSRKLKLQKKALQLKIVPQTDDFVMSPVSANDIIEDMHLDVSEPQKFILFNRVERTLSNLKNIGRIADVSEVLQTQSENDESYLESTYTLIRGLIWAIPVLGFVGTVLGLSYAIGGFGDVVAQGADLEKLKDSLGGVTSGLSIAFETTLIALVSALIIHLFLTMLLRQEEAFLDECSDYCHKNIISKLKTLGLREEFDLNSD